MSKSRNSTPATPEGGLNQFYTPSAPGPASQELPPSPPHPASSVPFNNFADINLNCAHCIEDTEVTCDQLSTTITNAMGVLIGLSKVKEDLAQTRLTQAHEEADKLIADAKTEARKTEINSMLESDELIAKVKESAATMGAEKAAWEQEKLIIKNTQTYTTRIKLDIGGMQFATSLATLTRYPESLFGKMFR